MLQLLSPAGLWTLAALALPVVIHLWRPPPMTVRLGSLRFLENLPHRRLRNLRWREYALLAVRMALLAVLALLAASPRWQTKPPAGPQRWVLLDPTAALSGESAQRLRQLRASGYEVRQLAPGLPIVDSDPAASADSAASSALRTPPPDLWSLLREADAALPPKSALAVFTPGRLAALRGERPALRNCRVEWVAMPDAAGTGVHPWLESLRRLPVVAERDAPAHAVVGESVSTFTRFSVHRLRSMWDSSPDALVRWSSGSGPNGSARLAGSPADTGVLVELEADRPGVAIYHDAENAEDAANVAAAVRAVSAETGIPFPVVVHALGGGVPPEPPPRTGWVFWLSARSLQARAAGDVPNVFCYAPTNGGIPATNEGWFAATPGVPGAGALAAVPVRLWRRVPGSAAANAGETLWADGCGTPLLTLAQTGDRRRWTFHSRFRADWNDLARTGVLAAWMRDLLRAPPSALPADPAHDLRLADPSQYATSIQPAAATVRPPTPPARTNAADLHWPLWWLAVALFAAERLLSRRPTNGPVSAPIPEPATTAAAAR